MVTKTRHSKAAGCFMPGLKFHISHLNMKYPAAPLITKTIILQHMQATKKNCFLWELS